jgi:hypothetical protein
MPIGNIGHRLALDNASLTPEGRKAKASSDLWLLLLDNGRLIDGKEHFCFMNI